MFCFCAWSFSLLTFEAFEIAIQREREKNELQKKKGVWLNYDNDDHGKRPVRL